MKVRLIALPWADFRIPQPAIGALTAYLRSAEPGRDVTAEYAYFGVAAEDWDMYRNIAADLGEGDRLYASLLYPEGAPALIKAWEAASPATAMGAYVAQCRREGKSAAWVHETMRERLLRHLDDLVARVDWTGSLVGLTTTYGQLFGNLLLAERIKQRAPDAVVVMGGSTVSPSDIADSFLASYPAIDAIVRGEGELPLAALVTQLERGQAITAVDVKGVVTRARPAASTKMWQVGDLDALPMPVYDEFFLDSRVDEIEGFMPVEGSRGCWWDRSTKDVNSTCHFCNLNVQWDGYRQKSAGRVAEELRTLAGRHRRTRFQFVDNIERVKGFDEFVSEIEKLDIDAWIFHEARANMRPFDILRFMEVGLRMVQFGIEALSDRVLAQINKGTSVIMNLEVMKICAELQITLMGNLIVNFPGTTDEDVTETLRAIDTYGSLYPPLEAATFALGIGSVVHKFPERYGVSRVRNSDMFQGIVPASVLDRLTLFDFSFDVDWNKQADWLPVIARVERWKREYRGRSFYYEDAGSALRLVRWLPGDPREVIDLVGLEAELYRFCMQIRRRSDIQSVYPAEDPELIDRVLADLVDRRLMYREKSRFLALAVARDGAVACRRIRKQHLDDLAREAARRSARGPERPTRLPVIGSH